METMLINANAVLYGLTYTTQARIIAPDVERL